MLTTDKIIKVAISKYVIQFIYNNSPRFSLCAILPVHIYWALPIIPSVQYRWTFLKKIKCTCQCNLWVVRSEAIVQVLYSSKCLPSCFPLRKVSRYQQNLHWTIERATCIKGQKWPSLGMVYLFIFYSFTHADYKIKTKMWLQPSMKNIPGQILPGQCISMYLLIAIISRVSIFIFLIKKNIEKKKLTHSW